jgi:hemoglobin/transferrin/lactoferrin receptor protein
MRKKLLLLWTIIANGVVFSQEAKQKHDSIKNTVTLSEMVISANKVEEDKKQIAQQIESISSLQIRKSNAQNTADLLQQNGFVNVQKSQQGGGSIIIRGFEASRVLMVVDGVRMNNLIYRAGHLQNAITVDQNMLERVEVLFGPSSTVYGSDALGGVVAFYSKNPLFAEGDEKLKTKVGLFTRYGSVNQEKTGHFDFNLGTKRFASLTSFTVSDFDDLKMGKSKNPYYKSGFGERNYYVERINDKDSLVANTDKYLQKFSGYTQYDLLQKFSFNQNEKITHGLSYQYSNSSNIPRYDRLTDPKGKGLNSAEWYYGPQMRMLGIYNLSAKNLTGFFTAINANLSYQKIEESRHNRNFNSSNKNSRIEKVDVYGLNVDFQRKKEKSDTRVGIDAQYNTVNSTAFRTNIISGEKSALDTRYPDGKNEMYNMAIYATNTYRITEKLILNDGLRLAQIGLNSNFATKDFFPFPFDQIKQNNTALSGNLGLVYLPDDKWKISLMGSTGYRAPNVDDLSKVFESTPGRIIVPNPNLKPEKTYNGDLQITKIFGKVIRWENVFFYTLFKDALVADKFTFNGEDSISYDGIKSAVFSVQNKQSAYIYGVSSNLYVSLFEHINVTGGLTYTYGRINTDSSDYPLDHISPLYGRGGIKYYRSKFEVEAFVMFNAWKRISDFNLGGEDNQQYAPAEGMSAWYTLNVRINYSITRNITLQAGVDNLLDTQYRVFASGINAPGRNIFGTVRLSF